MTSTTKSRRPEVVVTNTVQDTPAASPQRRPQRQYLALNGVAMVIIAALALTVIGILYLMQTAKVAGLGYQFSRLQNEYYSLSLENSKLGYDVARDQSLDKISQVATEQLGMTPLKNFQFIQVQRPANDNLPSLPPDVHPQKSLIERIKAALMGESSASLRETATPLPAIETQPVPRSGPATTPGNNAVATPQGTVGTAP